MVHRFFMPLGISIITTPKQSISPPPEKMHTLNELSPTTTPLRNLTTGSNHDRSLGSATLGSDRLNGLDNIHALDDGSENDVLSIKPGGFGSAEEELFKL